MRKILSAALATLVVGAGLVSPTAASAEKAGHGSVIYPRAGGLHGMRGVGGARMGAWHNGARFGGWNRGEAFRPGAGFAGGYGHHRSYGGYPGGYYGGYGYDDDGFDGGAVIAGGVLGLAAGAILSGALSHNSGGSIGWCQAHYRSYDVGSRSFMGNDGMRHPCPAR